MLSIRNNNERNLPSTLRTLEITKSFDLTDACTQYFMPEYLPHLRQLALAPGSRITAEALSKLPPYVVIYTHAHNNMWNSKLHSHLPSLYFF